MIGSPTASRCLSSSALVHGVWALSVTPMAGLGSGVLGNKTTIAGYTTDTAACDAATFRCAAALLVLYCTRVAAGHCMRATAL